MILLDVFEPDDIKLLISQVTEVSQVSLNTLGYADYQWASHDGRIIQVERKQMDEILGGLDHVEEQLRREFVKTDETILVIEGSCEPVQDIFPMTRSWKMAKSRKVMIPHHNYKLSYAGLQAWLYQIAQVGIHSFHTMDSQCTARAICAWYNSDQKEEHSTFKRYIKDRVVMPRGRDKENPEPFNPHILNLMSIKGGGIGEVIAKALIAKYGTYWAVVSQEMDMLAETRIGQKRFGEVAAKKLLRSIGRI